MAKAIERVEVVRGDITKLEVDAIVNAANQTLMGGGGVDGAIHKAAGPQLLEECKNLGGCPTGYAKVTGGHNLPAKWVIHTVGPVWEGGEDKEAEMLESCYRKSLEQASRKAAKSVAFPSISTGAYRFPMEKAAEIAVKTVLDELEKREDIEKVIFCVFDDKAEREYWKVLDRKV